MNVVKGQLGDIVPCSQSLVLFEKGLGKIINKIYRGQLLPWIHFKKDFTFAVNKSAALKPTSLSPPVDEFNRICGTTMNLMQMQNIYIQQSASSQYLTLRQ